MRIKFAKRRGTNVANPIPRTASQNRRNLANGRCKRFPKETGEARKRLGAQSAPTAPLAKTSRSGSALNATTDTQTVQQVSRADRLAELRNNPKSR